ncbi:type II toxin-antitoxin system VapC family toxin [Mucilaginibacter sp.]
MKKIFLDSDILLDALLKRQHFLLPAMNVLALADKKSSFQLMTSAVAFVNVHYFLDKFDRPNKYRLLNFLRPNISIVKVDEKAIDLALRRMNNDFEDTVQYFTALNAGADVIITRNKKDYIQSDIPVLTAEEFLKTL